MTEKFRNTEIRPIITDAYRHLLKGSFAESLASSTLARAMMQFNETQQEECQPKSTEEMELERRR